VLADDIRCTLVCLLDRVYVQTQHYLKLGENRSPADDCHLQELSAPGQAAAACSMSCSCGKIPSSSPTYVRVLDPRHQKYHFGRCCRGPRSRSSSPSRLLPRYYIFMPLILVGCICMTKGVWLTLRYPSSPPDILKTTLDQVFERGMVLICSRATKRLNSYSPHHFDASSVRRTHRQAPGLRWP
jgi:hypothetical protein